MCGVAAIYAYHPASSSIDHRELRKIRDHMAARGPDGFGEWFSTNNRIALGHRRLAIIDPQARAGQPMASTDGNLMIVFNGEIYNFRQLRHGLEQRGFTFQTASDTEVLLQLYAEKQEAMLKDLRGMFAFTIWDASRNRLFLARDLYGIKPLYYADDGHTLRVASQVKALLAGGKVSLSPDPAGIVGFHLLGSVPEPFTWYQQIQLLPAGSYLFADERGLGEPQQWCSLADQLATTCESVTSQDEFQSAVTTALLDSVRAHLVADVSVGAFLSSGIDSGSLVGLMRDAGANNIQTVTLAFDEFKGSSGDEAPLAEKVAQHYGTSHVTRRVGLEEFKQDLPRILHAMDQPSIDGINTWFVSKAAAELGLKVAVSGLGGDELFSGYPSFKDLPNWRHWLRYPSAIPYLGKALRATLAPLCRVTEMSPKAAGMLEFGGTWEGAYLLRRGLFMPWELPALLGEELARDGMQRLEPLKIIHDVVQDAPNSDFARVTCLESSFYMRNQLLRDADWAGMAHSLEIRVPLVDSMLLRSVGRLAQQDSNWSKQRLASAPTRVLPEEINQRSKTGFTTPIGNWMVNPGVMGVNNEMNLPSHCHWARRWCRNVNQVWAGG